MYSVRYTSYVQVHLLRQAYYQVQRDWYLQNNLTICELIQHAGQNHLRNVNATI